MPTYEYQCLNCGYRFEAFQRVSDEPLERCPKCQGEVKRLISGGTGVIFKGSGFYATDRTEEACCGITNPCDNPKRCCSR